MPEIWLSCRSGGGGGSSVSGGSSSSNSSSSCVVVVRAVYHVVVQDICSQNLKDTLVRMSLCLSQAGFWVRGAMFPKCFSFCKASRSKSEPIGSREINWTCEWWRDII